MEMLEQAKRLEKARKTIDFDIPGLPKTTNSGGRAHWAVKAKEAREWKRFVYACVRSSGFKGGPFPKAKLTLTRHSAVEPDFDGLVSSFKHVIDGLVEAGVIPSDKPSVIGQPDYRWERAPRGRGYIRVKVEPAELTPDSGDPRS